MHKPALAGVVGALLFRARKGPHQALRCLRADIWRGRAGQKGGHVLIEAEPGQTLAEIVSGPAEELPGQMGQDLPAILRHASSEDIHRGEANEQLAREAQEFCRQCIRDRDLDMKLVDVEVFFDRSKLIFYFTAPSRIDFRDLVKDLVREYRARIELRQIGVRHETQMVGAVGNCGMIGSFLAALLAVKVFIALMGRLTLVPFAIYRLLIAPFIYYFMVN